MSDDLPRTPSFEFDNDVDRLDGALRGAFATRAVDVLVDEGGEGEPEAETTEREGGEGEMTVDPVAEAVMDAAPLEAVLDRERRSLGGAVARLGRWAPGLAASLAVAAATAGGHMVLTGDGEPETAAVHAEAAAPAPALRSTDLIGAAQLLTGRITRAAASTGAEETAVRAAVAHVLGDLSLAAGDLGRFRDALEVERARIQVADEAWRPALETLDGIWERGHVTGRPQREQEVLCQHGDEYGAIYHPATSHDARIARRLVEVYEGLLTHATLQDDDTDRRSYLKLIRREKAVEFDGDRVGWFARRERLSADWAYALERALAPSPDEGPESPALDAARTEARTLLAAVRAPVR